MLMFRIQRKTPYRGIVIAGPGSDYIRDHMEVFIHFNHVLINQAAQQLIGMVCRHKGVFAVIGI